MDYPTALAQLHDLTRLGVRPGLEREAELLCRLGNPERQLTAVHIAGTNGKGSTASMLHSILLAAGHRVGLFTSPHLSHHCERYRINGTPLSEGDFTALFEEVKAAIDSMVQDGFESPTEFEAVTALAFLAFAKHEVDVAVLECGLGGLYDSTNVILPKVSVITGVAMDHMNFLGSSIQSIANEKAGIIKPGVPCLTAADGEALSVIRAKSLAVSAPLEVLGEGAFAISAGVDGGFTLSTPGGTYENLRLSLLGAHQRKNAALAIRAAELLGCDEAAVRKGVLATCWPGRLELLPGEPPILLDGAHNAQGMAALAAALCRHFPEMRICCLLGMLADKEREEALSHLLPHIAQAVVTPPPYLARQGDWQTLAAICESTGIPAEAVEDNAAALLRAKEIAADGFDLLLVCGSLYLVGELRKLITGEELPRICPLP